jgi:hypothetical protein
LRPTQFAQRISDEVMKFDPTIQENDKNNQK